MFARHHVQRAYVAVVHGDVEAQTIDTWLIRDRGDGLRGSTPLGEAAEGAQRAITHIRPMEHLPDYTILECRLETGRTHQIRIHLSEIGHRLCGEKVYTHAPGEPPQADPRSAPASPARRRIGIAPSNHESAAAFSDAASQRSEGMGAEGAEANNLNVRYTRAVSLELRSCPRH